jgi:large-conductance mechanosensitive channel
VGCLTRDGSACRPSAHIERTRGGGVNLKKVITWLVVAFVVFYVIQAPESSAQLVRNAGQALGDAASSLAAFVGSLV